MMNGLKSVKIARSKSRTTANEEYKLMTKRLSLLGCVSFLLILWALPASACGGFFCTNVPIDQNAERIIFTVNKNEGTITAIVGINYTGEAKDFSWVVPVPSVPKVDVAEKASLDLLEAGTNKQFTEPSRYCSSMFDVGGRGGGGGDYVVEGHVGPYDYAIIRNENPGELVQWLRDNSYRVTDDMIPIITDYVKEGMYFLAMKLSQDAQVGDIQPVMMTYQDTQPMIPLRLTAVAAVDNMPVLVWIFADTQYVPQNYAHPEANYSKFRNKSQILTPYSEDNFAPYTLYRQELTRIQDEHSGKAFITEYAQPTATLPPAVQDDSLMGNLIKQFPYVTRMRAQLSPEQMTVDPTFIRDTTAQDISPNVDLNEWVDPLQYWGCSTRSIKNMQAISLLPEHTPIAELRLDVAHPAGWKLSALTIGDAKEQVWVVAQEPVNTDTLAAFFRGEQTVPMFIAHEARDCSDCGIFRSFGVNDDSIIPGSSYSPVRFRQSVFGSLSIGIVYGILASDSQWEQDKMLYTAMLDYADTYQYYASTMLPNTLFLGSYNYYYNDSIMPSYIGYPDGWIEHWDKESDTATIMLDNGEPDAPTARLIPIERFTAEGKRDYRVQQATLDTIADQYQLSESVKTVMEAQLSRSCLTNIGPLAYEQNGRQGYLKIRDEYVLEISTPSGDFAQYEATFDQIAASLNNPMAGCG